MCVIIYGSGLALQGPADQALEAASIHDILGDPEVTANVYSKSCNLPKTDTQNYNTDLRYLLGHPVDIHLEM